MMTGSKRGVTLKPQLVGTTHKEAEYHTVKQFNKINCASFFRDVSSFALYCFGCWHWTDVIEVLMQSSGEPIHLLPTHNLSFWCAALWPLCRLSSSARSLAPAWISPSENQTPEKPRARGNEWMRRGPAGNLTTRCEGVTLSLCSLAAVRAFSERESWTSVCTVACQKSLRCVKSHDICTQRAGHETRLFAFP